MACEGKTNRRIKVVDAPRDFDLVIRLADTNLHTWVLRAWARDAGNGRRWADVTEDATTKWAASDPSVLELDPARPGVVRAAAREGRGIVAVRHEGCEDAWTVEVREGKLSRGSGPGPDVAPYLITGLTFRLEVGTESPSANSNAHPFLRVTARPADAVRVTCRTSHWCVQALRPGPIALRAESDVGVCAEYEIHAYDESVRLRDIRVEPESGPAFSSLNPFFLWLGTAARPRVQLETRNGALLDAGLNVRWTSSAPDGLALEDAGDGEVRMVGRRTGVATLAAECLNARSTLEVDVREEPEIQWF